ncbi:MAG: cytochrome C oxidase subunit IV family protein [Pyrinomonadaceae bacterium]
MSTENIVPRKTYLLVFAGLVILTTITVFAARFDMGFVNTPIALGIAIAKAMLIVLFFMNVRHSSLLTKLVIIGGVLWLLILLTLTMVDYSTRHFKDSPYQKWRVETVVGKN